MTSRHVVGLTSSEGVFVSAALKTVGSIVRCVLYVQDTQDRVSWIQNCSVQSSTFAVVVCQSRGAFALTEERRRLLYCAFLFRVFRR